MENSLAINIITEYTFGNYEIKSIYKYLPLSITDGAERKLYAESLLTKAMQKAVIALNQKEYSALNNTEIRKIEYEACPLKCTSCKALCDEMPVGQCRKKLSEKFDIDKQF